jgi:transcriptional regulator with XRE-family HTH domain
LDDRKVFVPEKNRKFAIALRLLRGNESQAAFAHRLGIVSQAAYAKYELGRVPKPAILEKLSRSLGIETENLLEGDVQSVLPPVSADFVFDRFFRSLSEAQLREISQWLHESQQQDLPASIKALLSTALASSQHYLSALLLCEDQTEITDRA